MQLYNVWHRLGWNNIIKKVSILLSVFLKLFFCLTKQIKPPFDFELESDLKITWTYLSRGTRICAVHCQTKNLKISFSWSWMVWTWTKRNLSIFWGLPLNETWTWNLTDMTSDCLTIFRSQGFGFLLRSIYVSQLDWILSTHSMENSQSMSSSFFSRVSKLLYQLLIVGQVSGWKA